MEEIKPFKLIDAPVYGASSHKPLLALGGDLLLAVEVLLLAVSLECALGDGAPACGENLERLFNGDVLVSCRGLTLLVVAWRVRPRQVRSVIVVRIHMVGKGTLLWYHFQERREIVTTTAATIGALWCDLADR